MPRYLLWCANDHLEFRLPELMSLIHMFNIPVQWIEKPRVEPYFVVEFPEESYVHSLLSRSVLVRSCYELWARAKSSSALHEELARYPKHLMEQYFAPESSFRMKVDTFCKTLTFQDKLDRINSFSYLPVKGPVKLNNPDVSLHLIEYYGLDPNRVPEKPHDLFFGRWVGDGQRDLIFRLSLKNRKFIGNTSMDSQLSLLMANQAQVRTGDLVFDPFVGTGSLLVAAATFGGYVWGTDIDYLTLHAKTKPTRFNEKVRQSDESLKANFVQYGCLSKFMDVMVADASVPVWKDGFQWDAIITDPPYGIRESTERIGTTKNHKIPEQYLAEHIPSKVEYSLRDIYSDLVAFAAKNLRLGGHLVFWIPIYRPDYKEEQLPSHPCLERVANSEQILTNHSSRRLLTMRKIREDQDYDSGSVDPTTAVFRKKYFQAVKRKRGQGACSGAGDGDSDKSQDSNSFSQ